MSVLQLLRTNDIVHFDQNNCIEEGKRLAAQYKAAEPFPHIAIDCLLDPQILREAAVDFPDIEGKEFFDRDQERLKFSLHPMRSRQDYFAI